VQIADELHNFLDILASVGGAFFCVDFVQYVIDTAASFVHPLLRCAVCCAGHVAGVWAGTDNGLGG
jgi:hypothetical protein